MRISIAIIATITYLFETINSLRYLENPIDYFRGENDTLRCPKVACGTLNGTCAERSINEIKNKNFTLQSCKESYQACPFTIADITNDGFEPKTCTNKTVQEIKRYPGEACTEDAQCHWGGKGCVSKKCNATDPVNNTCTMDSDCLAGNWCNVTVCAKQIALGANCTSSLQCVNSAACYDGKCTE